MRWSSAVVRAVLVLPVVAFRVPEIPTNFGVDQHIVQHMDSARVLPATSRHSSISKPRLAESLESDIHSGRRSRGHEDDDTVASAREEDSVGVEPEAPRISDITASPLGGEPLGATPSTRAKPAASGRHVASSLRRAAKLRSHANS